MKKTLMLAALSILTLAASACERTPNQDLIRAEQVLVTAGHTNVALYVQSSAEGDVCPGVDRFLVYRSDKGVGVICTNSETRVPLIQNPGPTL